MIEFGIMLLEDLHTHHIRPMYCLKTIQVNMWVYTSTVLQLQLSFKVFWVKGVRKMQLYSAEK